MAYTTATTATADDIAAVKKWLSGMRQLQSSYEHLLDRYLQAQAIATSPRSAELDGMPRGTSNPVDTIGAAVARLEPLRQRVKAAEEKKNAYAAEIQASVDKIGGASWAAKRTVIECRYLDFLSWPDTIAVLYGREPDFDLRYDTFHRRTFYIYAEALAALAEIRKGVQHDEQ